MPHSTKKHKKQVKPGARINPKWYAVIAVVAALIFGSGIYLAFPQVSSGFQSVFGTKLNNSSSEVSTSSLTGCSGCVYAVITTSQGVIEVELFQGLTPKTVANFVSLADSGFFNNLVWHRIVKGFVIQTGDPNTRNGGGNEAEWGTGGSNTSVPLELSPSLSNDEGYVAMAHTATSTNSSSQFYINLANNSNLDGQYTVFGKVIKGMDVALAIGNLPVNSQDMPLNSQQAMMISVVIQSAP